MKNWILIIVTSMFMTACGNRDTSLADRGEAGQIVIGQMDSLYSDILGETRDIWVSVPDAGGIFSATDYPVLYLLDGPGHFHGVTGLLKSLGDISLIPKMVVVAIANTDRTRDMTPSHVDMMFGDSAFVRTSGGADNFLAFMEQELIPYIEEKYPVTGYRTFVGHSFGGLVCVHALFSQPQLFSSYVAIDPSLRWDDQLLVKRAGEVLNSPELEGKALYLGVANTMQEGMDLEQVREDTAEGSAHIRSILSFIELAEGAEGNGMDFAWKYYPDDDHGSVPLITEYDAFRFLFNWYPFKAQGQFMNEELADEPDAFMEVLESHYREVSERFGYQVLAPEQLVNSLGYNFMAMEKPMLSKAMFELNIQNYPESANVYDSMGDCYLAQSDSVKAIENFEKALELGENPITKDKLKQLR